MAHDAIDAPTKQRHLTDVSNIRTVVSSSGDLGRPVSAVTIEFLAWCAAQLTAQGFTALLLIWDNASWHRSQAVRHWIRQHNQQVKRGAEGVHLVVCPLPSKSPWLNPIEPKWLHAKGRVVEPAGLLSSQQLAQRVCDTFGTPYEPHLAVPEYVP